MTYIRIASAILLAGLASPVLANDGAQGTLPANLRQALNMPEWFLQDAQDAPDLLDASVQSLLAASDPALRDINMDRLLDLPLGAFTGVLFGQVNKTLNPLPDTKGSDGETMFEVGAPLNAVDMPPLQDAFRMTQCYVVSENDLKDGAATAFQFSEHDSTGYSLSFVIYDYKGPGTYAFDGTTLNYFRYAPHALVGMVMATREIDGVATVVGQFTSADTGGALTIRELPDGSIFGRFDVLTVGSTDMTASRDGAKDKYFVSQFTGAFRTGSLAAPVVVEFVPKPMIGAPADMKMPDVTPTSNVRVVSRSSDAACPKIED
jgi:hypothetical protein